jgi:ABC-type iron transport system FetAB ATPase subunit
MTQSASKPSPQPTATRLQIRNLQSPLAGPFSFDLAAGECLTISGPSGAGKSLLLRMLCDLDPNTGEAVLNGVPRAGMGAPAWRARVVYQPAEAAWWLPTAGEHFKPGQMPRVQELLPQLNLSPSLLESEITRLSTGERQRMALIRSLACAPQVLLLDEPTAALDPAAVAATELLLKKELAAGLSIILVTHSEAQAHTLGHRNMTMRDRRLTESAP